jgi:hypothetical protein
LTPATPGCHHLLPFGPTPMAFWPIAAPSAPGTFTQVSLDVSSLPAAPPFLGSIYLASNPGTPVGRFDFLVDLDVDARVEIGTPVAADTQEGTVVGTVIDMRTVGTGRDPVAAEMSTSYDESQVAVVPEVVVATVQVFHSDALRPVRSGRVRAATADEMLAATGFSRMEWPVPAGVVPLADGSFARVCFDGTALLGPESAHLMVGGLSGQAAKTSYAGVLLRSAIDAGSPKSHSTAALLFNVKGTDLLYLDEPPAAGYELSEDDLDIYDALGVPPTPFADVTVYGASFPGGTETRSERSDAALLRWGLRDVWRYLRYIWPWMYEDDKVMGFLGSFEDLHLYSKSQGRIDTFDRMLAWMEAELQNAEDNNADTCFGGRTHVATMRKLLRMFRTLPERFGGLLTTGESRLEHDVPDSGWSHGQAVVVDLAGLSTEIQGLVIARTCERVLKSAEDGELGVDHLVVLADELNAFAPAQGGEMSQVRKILQRISTQGRYAGVSLWGAAQKLSKVDELVRDNAASRAVGVLADAEVSSGVYGKVSGGLAERLVTLPKGHMALWHYSFRSALVVRFPRPAWRTGKAKTTGGTRPTTRSVLAQANNMTAASLERLTEGIPDEVAERIVAAADDPAAAAAALDKAREPDMSKVVLHEPSTFDPDDPFQLNG